MGPRVAAGSGGDEEQDGEEGKEETIGEMGVEMGKKHERPPVVAPQEDNTGCVGMPQESLVGLGGGGSRAAADWFGGGWRMRYRREQGSRTPRGQAKRRSRQSRSAASTWSSFPRSRQ